MDEEYFLWENCFTKAIKTIGDVKSICFDYGYHVSVILSYTFLHLLLRFQVLRSFLTVVLEIHQLRQFLNCIKLLINGALNISIYIDAVPNEIVNIFSEFLKSENVRKISVSTKKSNSAEL